MDAVAAKENLSAGYGDVVGKDRNIVVRLRIEFDQRAAAHAQKLLDGHGGRAEDDRKLDLDLVDALHPAPPRAYVCSAAEMAKPRKPRPIMVSGTLTAPSSAPHHAAVEWRIAAGLTPYPAAVDAMEARVAAIHAGKAPELAWLVEHPPLYTAGTSARAADLLDPDRFPVFPTGRGGQLTYHGPGQRVGYVMLDLGRRGRDVRAHVAGLEEWLIRTLAAFGVRGERRADRVGVWLRRPDKGPGAEDKIAAIGVRVRRWVTFHGVALNVAPNLDHYRGIVPCGIAGGTGTPFGVTSLADLGVSASTAEVDDALRTAFVATFGPVAG